MKLFCFTLPNFSFKNFNCTKCYENNKLPKIVDKIQLLLPCLFSILQQLEVFQSCLSYVRSQVLNLHLAANNNKINYVLAL